MARICVVLLSESSGGICVKRGAYQQAAVNTARFHEEGENLDDPRPGSICSEMCFEEYSVLPERAVSFRGALCHNVRAHHVL